MARKPNLNLPRCPEHPGSTVRAEGTQGNPPRQRLRCFYTDVDGQVRKHGFRPPAAPQDAWGVLFGGRYTAGDVSDALVDVARGASYTDAARRARLARTAPGSPPSDDVAGFDGRLVATWVDRFAPALIAAHAETSWPASLVLDSTEFTWTNPRTGDRQQLFTVLAAWGYPSKARRGRLWALRAAPTDSGAAWADLLSSLPGTPQLVVYDSDKGIKTAVEATWPQVALHLCEHHLYINGRNALRSDGQHGRGNLYHGLLARAATSYTDWSAFRNAVKENAQLVHTGNWVDHWDAQMGAQTARRSSLPPHYSTGALDPHIAKVRATLKPRAWTYRNLTRMNHLLGLVRLSVNLCDRPSDWAALLAGAAVEGTTGDWADEPATFLPNGDRVHSLRTHPVPPRN